MFEIFTFRNSLFQAFIINRHWCHYSKKDQQRKYAAFLIRTLFFLLLNTIVFQGSGIMECCVIFLDMGTFSSDCYLYIFEIANSHMHIFEKDFYYHSKCSMIVICPAIQRWFLTNIFLFFLLH